MQYIKGIIIKTFIKHDIPSIERIDSPNGRLYATPTGQKYPSVTTVVGFKSVQYIEEWRARVGEEAANRISGRASKRGTAIHSLCEEYLLGEQAIPNMFDADMFNSLKPFLDKIDNIHCLETQMFSHKLEVAGTTDAIAEYDGMLSIIDFKTSGRVKEKKDIDGYFIQCGAYAYMIYELTGLVVTQIVIIMGVDNENPLIFKEPVKKWVGKFIELRKEFKQVKGY